MRTSPTRSPRYQHIFAIVERTSRLSRAVKRRRKAELIAALGGRPRCERRHRRASSSTSTRRRGSRRSSGTRAGPSDDSGGESDPGDSSALPPVAGVEQGGWA